MTSLCLLLLAAATLAGCDDMRDGSRLKPYEPSAFFAGGSASQHLPAEVVARGDPIVLNTPLLTGRDADGWVQALPMAVDEPLLRRGRIGFQTFCANCHGSAGYGDGMIVQRGHPAPPSFHSDRLRQLPEGHLFHVVTAGYGKMQPLGSLIRPEERWAIIAYLRVLQESQFFRVQDLPPPVQQELQAMETEP